MQADDLDWDLPPVPQGARTAESQKRAALATKVQHNFPSRPRALEQPRGPRLMAQDAAPQSITAADQLIASCDASMPPLNVYHTLLQRVPPREWEQVAPGPSRCIHVLNLEP